MSEGYTIRNPLWHGIPGWFNYEDFYSQLVVRLRDGDIVVEVGCWLGQSACYLGGLIKDSGKQVKLLCVDPWYPGPHLSRQEDGFGTFYSNVRQSGLASVIVPIRATSADAARFLANDLAAVFIDGEHDYATCIADIRAWLPKVRRGGIIAGHDYDTAPSAGFPGVAKAVSEMFGKGFRTVGWCWVHDKI